jgi:hypothetical protein
VADAGRVSRPGLKVLFITGYAESAEVGNGLLDEGMELVTKPFEGGTGGEGGGVGGERRLNPSI